MKNEKKISVKELEDKLNKIIEQSMSENAALKKVLQGLEKINDNRTNKFNKK